MILWYTSLQLLEKCVDVAVFASGCWLKLALLLLASLWWSISSALVLQQTVLGGTVLDSLAGCVVLAVLVCLPFGAAIDEQLGFASEKVLYLPLLASLVDSTACHHGDSPLVCVCCWTCSKPCELLVGSLVGTCALEWISSADPWSYPHNSIYLLIATWHNVYLCLVVLLCRDQMDD